MLQVKRGPIAPFKIKSMRKSADKELIPSAHGCPAEAGDGTDKPPC